MTNQEMIIDILQQHHRQDVNKIYLLLKRKYMTAKKRFDMSKEEIEQVIISNYGTQCRYCGKKLIYNTISFDHIIPLGREGKKDKDNLHIICKTCNRRKGIMTYKEYKKLLKFIAGFPIEVQKYVLRKLSMADFSK